MNLQKSLISLAKWCRQSALVVLSVLSFAAMPALANDPIRIGAVLSVTGNISYLGEAERRAMDLMIDKVNQEGGVLGRPLELVFYDDASNAERARTMMQRLITQDGVSVVIGASSTSSSMAMETLASRHGIPQVSMAGARALTDPVKKWLFAVAESDVMTAQVIYEHMKNSGITKIALLSSTAGFGRAARDTFFDRAEEYDIEIVMDETYGAGDTDMTAQLTRIRSNADVQALITLGAGNQPAIVARNYKSLGMTVPAYTDHGHADFEFVELAGEAGEGLRMPAASMVVADQLPEGSKERELGMAFRRLYQDRYGSQPGIFPGYGHDALMLVVDAIRRAGNTDPVAIRDALEQTSDLVGVTSTLTFGPDNHGGVFEKSGMRLVEIRNGGFVLVE